MKSHFIRDLEAGQQVLSTFMVLIKDVRQKKTGEPYLSLVLGDRSGELEAKMWDNIGDVVETFDRDDFVKVKGLLQVYQNRPQLTIHKMARIDEREVSFADFFPASARDPDEMFGELQGVIAGIGNPHLKTLLEEIFRDEDIARRYRTAPAAKAVHHAWLGGLIEHVLSLCQFAKFAAAHYKYIDADLLLAGVILHDIGKIYELSYHRSFGYTDEGQLIGHITMALRIVDEKVRRVPDFPAKLRMLVDHMILSHHGSLEFGSPKVPLFLEALLLHHLDNLDSKMESMRAAVERDRLVESDWSAYIPALERTALKKEAWLEERPPAAEETAAGRPVPKPPRPPQPAQNSLFAEKLKDALKPEN